MLLREKTEKDIRVMFSVEDCKKVLSSKGNKYTDEEVARIREFLYNMTKVVDEEYLKAKKDGGEKKL